MQLNPDFIDRLRWKKGNLNNMRFLCKRKRNVQTSGFYGMEVQRKNLFWYVPSEMKGGIPMSITIWHIFGSDSTGHKVWEEYYLFKRSAKRAFNALAKAYPKYNWSYSGEPLYLF